MKRWPVTVTFAMYFDHEPDGLELGRIASWAQDSLDNTERFIDTFDEAVVGKMVSTAPVGKERASCD